MANNNQNNANGSQLSGNEIPFLVMLIGAAGFWKYHREMEAWFHDNLVSIVLTGAVLLTMLGYFIVWRMKKNDRESIRRMETLSKAKGPSRPVNSFYERRNDNDRSQN
jgi:hypothetical protein